MSCTLKFLTKRRLGFASLAAVVGCGLACALPLLGAAAGLTGLARWLAPGTELIAGGLAFGLALGLMAAASRRSAVVMSRPSPAAALLPAERPSVEAGPRFTAGRSAGPPA
jgi:hypothetical protein